MNHDSYDDSYIRGILNTVKTIAMVGASEKENRPSYFAFKYLLERGYRMIPVNPGHAGEDMLGQRIYARLADIPEPVDMIDIFRGSQYALAIVQEALALKTRPQVIWMQLGVRNDEAAALAEANGMKVVMNRCPKIEYGRLSSEIAWMGVNTRTLSSKKAHHRRHPAHDAQPHQRPGRRHDRRRPRPARRRRTLRFRQKPARPRPAKAQKKLKTYYNSTPREPPRALARLIEVGPLGLECGPRRRPLGRGR